MKKSILSLVVAMFFTSLFAQVVPQYQRRQVASQWFMRDVKVGGTLTAGKYVTPTDTVALMSDLKKKLSVADTTGLVATKSDLSKLPTGGGYPNLAVDTTGAMTLLPTVSSGFSNLQFSVADGGFIIKTKNIPALSYGWGELKLYDQFGATFIDAGYGNIDAYYNNKPFFHTDSNGAINTYDKNGLLATHISSFGGINSIAMRNVGSVSDAFVLTTDFGFSMSDNNGIERTTIDRTGIIKTSKYTLSALNTPPASATDTGATGEIRVCSDYIYVCIATNTWVRTALTTW